MKTKKERKNVNTQVPEYTVTKAMPQLEIHEWHNSITNDSTHTKRSYKSFKLRDKIYIYI